MILILVNEEEIIALMVKLLYKIETAADVILYEQLSNNLTRPPGVNPAAAEREARCEQPVRVEIAVWSVICREV